MTNYDVNPGPKNPAKEKIAICICEFQENTQLNANQLSEKCKIPYRTAKRYIEKRHLLNQELSRICPPTQVERTCVEYGIEVKKEAS